MYTFGIIAGVVVVLGIIGMIASTYTEKFERNFHFYWNRSGTCSGRGDRPHQHFLRGRRYG